MKGAKDKWLRNDYEKAPKRDIRFTTISDLPVEPLYDPTDLEGFDSEVDLGVPGQYPFTRGIQKTMYRGRLWTMRQFAGFGTAKDTNQRYHFLLQNGLTGLSVAFDFPTLYGRDSDDPMARGEVGKCGVAIDTLTDMETLFDGIPLDKVTTSMTINPPASILLAMYLVVAEKQGVKWDQVGGTIQNDMLKEFIAQKTWIFPPRPHIKIITDILDFCTKYVPKWNTISISGYHIREAGSTAVQELAFTIADGIAYVQAGVEAGLDVDSFAPRLSFFFNAHSDFFEEVVKFRAARRMWAKIMKERFKAKDPRSWMLRFHTQTAGCSLTAQQPMNNIVRTTIQAISAIMGGTQSLHTNSMDETMSLPTEQAVTVALRTQQIIAEESGIPNVIDPLGGSYYIEALTNKMEAEATEYIRKIDEMGGTIAAIENGYQQREISNAAYHYQMQVEQGIKTVVGINKYAMDEPVPIPLLKIPDEVEKDQIERLENIRKTRNNTRCEDALDEVENSAREGKNIMYPILDAVRAYASEGEIVQRLKKVYGEYRDPAYL